MFKKYGFTICASVVVLGLGACAVDEKRMPAKGVDAPSRVDVVAPKGLKNDVYYDAELQKAIDSLKGVERTLNRLEGTHTSTMERIAMMREELHETNLKLVEFQNNLRRADELAPVSVSAAISAPVARVSAPAVDVVNAPQEITGDMGRPDPITGAAVAEALLAEHQLPAPAAASVPMSVPQSMRDTPKVEDLKSAEQKAAKQKSAVKAKTEPVKAAAAPKGVKAARVGVHDDKVRVVLDVVGSKVAHDAHFDDAERILTVDLPGLVWNAAVEQDFANNPAIHRYSVQKSEGGSVVVFALKEGVKPISQNWIGGVGGKDSRMILDFTR